MRFAAYLLLTDNSYRDLEQTIEADSPREAAQQAFDRLVLHPDEQFPQLLIVPDEQVHVFTRDDEGRAVTTTEDAPRMMAQGPKTVSVTFCASELGEET